MKKLLSLLLCCLVALSLQAQVRDYRSLEVMTGVGLARGPRVYVTSQYIAQFDMGGGLWLGAGFGLRIGRPCVQYVTKGGKHERRFCNEYDVPLFFRCAYRGSRYYAAADFGYAMGVYSFYGREWEPGGMRVPCYDGIFVEPHLGVHLGRYSVLALGVLLQRSTVVDTNSIESGTPGTALYSVKTESIKRNVLTPAINLRYGVIF